MSSEIQNTTTIDSATQSLLLQVTEQIFASLNKDLTPEQLALLTTQFSQLPGFSFKATPDLEAPTVTADSLAAVASSLESLLETLNFKERKQAVNDGMNAIEQRSKERKEYYEEKISKLQENIEKSGWDKFLDGLKTAFKYIGMVVGTIAAIATMATGFMTANPLMVAGGAALLYLSINSIVSDATDGKVSLGAGVAEIAKLCGADEKTAQYIGMAYELLATIVAVAVTLGGSIGTATSTIANTVSRFEQIAANANKVASITNAVVQVGSGATQIGAAVREYDKAEQQAFIKEIEAVLERIQQSENMDLDFIDTILKQVNELMESVTDMVNNSIQTKIAIQTSSPVMA